MAAASTSGPALRTVGAPGRMNASFCLTWKVSYSSFRCIGRWLRISANQDRV